MKLLLIILASGATGALFLLLHKSIRIHKKLFGIQEDIAGLKGLVRSDRLEQELSNVYAQLQAYLDLERLISPAAPLPRLRGWAASPDFLLVLSQHVLGRRPDVILECSSGASTVVLARCCQILGSGHVFSLEHAAEFAEKTRATLAAHGLTEWATVVDAPLRPAPEVDNRVWYSLENLPAQARECHMLVIDGPPAGSAEIARYPALRMLADRLSPGCEIFLDDYGRDDERQIVQRWLAETPGLKALPIETEKGCAHLRHE